MHWASSYSAKPSLPAWSTMTMGLGTGLGATTKLSVTGMVLPQFRLCVLGCKGFVGASGACRHWAVDSKRSRGRCKAHGEFFLASLRVFFNFSAHVPKECIGILQLTGLEGTIERLHVAAMILRRRFKRGHHCGSRLERVGPNWNHWGFPLRRRTRSMRASQSGGFRNALSLLHRSSHARRLGHAGPRNLPCRGRQLRHRPVHRREVEPGLLGVREPGKDRWLPRVRPEPSGAWIRKQVRGQVPGSRTGIGGRTKPSPPEHPVRATTRAARAAKSMQQSCGHRSQAGGAALYVVRYSNRRVPS